MPLRSLSFVDVETTGLSREDRIVTLGIVRIDDPSALAAGETAAAALNYTIFNPGRPSHPAARRVHGYDDAYLRHQDAFEEHAAEIIGALSGDRVLVAHNASFDKRFLTREFARAGHALETEFFCTMLTHKALHGAPSGLDAITRQMRYTPRGERHGALEDAWRAMAVYCWLHHYPVPPIDQLPVVQPFNARTPGAEPPRAPPAPFPTPLPAPVLRFPRPAFDLLSPLATVMLSIARADGAVLRAEIESVSLLMHTMLAGAAMRVTDDEQQDLLAALVDLDPNPDDIDRACATIAGDRNMSGSVVGWMRQVTYADGGSSEAERDAILRVAEGIRRARGPLGGV